MMRLPRGITGFHKAGEPELPEVDKKLFKQLCYNIILKTGGLVTQWTEAEYPNNYHLAQITTLHNHKDFFILLHQHFPFIAFASEIQHGEAIFIDVLEWKKYLSPYYQVLDTETLNQPFDEEQSSLSSDEIAEIRYWRPAIIGHIIFNQWG